MESQSVCDVILNGSKDGRLRCAAFLLHGGSAEYLVEDAFSASVRPDYHFDFAVMDAESAALAHHSGCMCRAISETVENSVLR